MMLGAVYEGGRFLVTKQFSQLESEKMYADLQRVSSTLKRELTLLHVLNKDWAHWNDSYEYMKSASEKFEINNFTLDTFNNLN